MLTRSGPSITCLVCGSRLRLRNKGQTGLLVSCLAEPMTGGDVSRATGQAKAVKAFPIADSLTKNVLEYLNYLRCLSPVPKFWLPSGRSVFGTYMMIPDRHLSDREVFNIVRETSETLWPHLF